MWWILLLVLAVLVIVLLYGNSRNEKFNSFEPRILGQVGNVTGATIADFIADTKKDQVRAIVIVDAKDFDKRKLELKRAIQMYSLIDQRIFPEIYEKILENRTDMSLMLAHHRKGRLEVYNMLGTPRVNSFADRATAKSELAKMYMSAGSGSSELVVAIIGKNLADIDEEKFGMYDSALISWLSQYSKCPHSN